MFIPLMEVVPSYILLTLLALGVTASGATARVPIVVDVPLKLELV